VLDDLEWDVKLYFALNAAVHEAACAAWSLKRYYDGGRPIEFIRFMGEMGQSSEPASPNYTAAHHEFKKISEVDTKDRDAQQYIIPMAFLSSLG
jgi:hypothetical protein